MPSVSIAVFFPLIIVLLLPSSVISVYLSFLVNPVVCMSVPYYVLSCFTK